MSISRVMAYLAAGLVVSGIGLLPSAKADEWNQKTTMTFSAPVEIPGQVLPPGTYVFELMDSASDRNVVEVYGKNERRFYGFFLAIPDYRMKPGDKPIITFEERAQGAPEAVKAWFYPGENYGHEFVYPKVKAMALAKVNNEAVPSMPNEMAANTTKPVKSAKAPEVMAMKNAPLKAEKPNQEEAEIAEVFTPAPASAAPTQPAMPKRLPKTGSSLPLIGLLGLISLGAAGSLRFVAHRMR